MNLNFVNEVFLAILGKFFMSNISFNLGSDIDRLNNGYKTMFYFSP